MTHDEARKWCSRRAVALTLTRDDVLCYKSSGRNKFFVPVPEQHLDVAFLAQRVLSFRGEVDFAGGLLWLRRWDIGSPQLVKVGWRILEDVRRAHGELRPLEKAPAQLFRADEFVELQGFLLQAIVYGWVADYIPSAGEYFAHFKDNGQICLSAGSLRTLKEMETSFRDWNPTYQDPMVVRMKLISKARLAK